MKMKNFFFYAMLVVAAITFAACSDDDGPERNPGPTVDQDDDNTTSAIDESYTYKLPVIFHVLYKDVADKKQHVSADRLAEILGHVNYLYQGNYYNTDIGSSENINVRFVLASHDERGNKLATPGVEYVKWNGSYPIDHLDFMNNNEKGYSKYLWEPNDYINVMVYNFAPESDEGEVTLGVSHLPFTLEGVNETDGLQTLDDGKANISKKNLSFAYCVSINSLYIDYQSDRYTNPDHNFKGGTLAQLQLDVNHTLAHELGHYLGLLHTFSEEQDDEGNYVSGSCTDTDYCTDTPSYDRPDYMRSLSLILNSSEGKSVSFRDLAGRTDCNGGSFFSTNILDYSYTYGFEFTPQQKARMRRILYNSPLMPGPKQRLRTGSRSAMPETAPAGIVDLPVRVIR